MTSDPPNLISLNLLPCPLCGDEGYIRHCGVNPDLYEALCSECNCKIDCIFTEIDGAVEAWNTRHVQSEISVADEDKMLILCQTLADLVEGGRPYLGSMAALIRPYLRTTKPVMVSLEKGAQAIENATVDRIIEEQELYQKPNGDIVIAKERIAFRKTGKTMAKACADAWGLAYGD